MARPFWDSAPQKVPGPPDQKSTSESQDVIWPFDANADHNAGYSSRSATIIKVEPLPEGTADIDTLRLVGLTSMRVRSLFTEVLIPIPIFLKN